jgi:hypothetical protein
VLSCSQYVSKEGMPLDGWALDDDDSVLCQERIKVSLA